MSIKKKYEPKTIGEIVVENKATKQRLTDYAEGSRTGHALLYGPQGTGKSSAARVISDMRTGGDLGPFCEPYEGATFDDTKLNRIFSDWCAQRFDGVAMPVAVINEIDVMPPMMQEKLKAFMDENDGLGAIIATTNNEHRLKGPFRDRFDLIEMPALSAEAFADRIAEIVAGEQVDVSDETLKAVLATTNGSWRDALLAADDIVIYGKRQAKP